MNGDRIAFVASSSPVAQATLTKLRDRYGDADLEEAKLMVHRASEQS